MFSSSRTSTKAVRMNLSIRLHIIRAFQGQFYEDWIRGELENTGQRI